MVQREGWQRFTIRPGTLAVARRAHVEADPPRPATSSPWRHAAARRHRYGSKAWRRLDPGDIRFIDAARQMGAQITSGPTGWKSRAKLPLKPSTRLQPHPRRRHDAGPHGPVCQGKTTLRNIASWRVKETDRIKAWRPELRKLGASVEEGADFIRITPPTGRACGWLRASTPMTTTGSPFWLRTWPLQPGAVAGTHPRPEMRGQDFPRLL